jgi:hypothetical protein
MFTRWDLVLWASGFLAGVGVYAMIVHLIPKHFVHHFTFKHEHRHGLNLTIVPAPGETADDADHWKRDR